MPEGGIENLKVFWAGSNLREKLQFLFELFDLDGDLHIVKYKVWKKLKEHEVLKLLISHFHFKCVF